MWSIYILNESQCIIIREREAGGVQLSSAQLSTDLIHGQSMDPCSHNVNVVKCVDIHVEWSGVECPSKDREPVQLRVMPHIHQWLLMYHR